MEPDGHLVSRASATGDRPISRSSRLDWQTPPKANAVAAYRERGYYPEAFVNMLALLGWEPRHRPGDRAGMEELIKLFDLEFPSG
ncbi:MAG: hypothetical protein IPF78_11210 [Flavobacteriales bacterium]|nr:hypothetical protein [Flavobacteriales bacterium]